MVFRAASTAYATCPACRSLVVRHDVNLENLGKVADLQPDGSPIQLGTSGTFLNRHFEVIGRIQVQYGNGFWNEWYLQYSDGKNGWLGEAMGTYFVNEELDPGAPLMREGDLRVGSFVTLKNEFFVCTEIGQVQLSSYEGEVPFLLDPKNRFTQADLRTGGQLAATLDYSDPRNPSVYIGYYVGFDDLKLQGLRDFDEERENQRGVATETLKCKSCGAPFELRAEGISQVVACEYCGTTMDVQNRNLQVIAQVQRSEKITPQIAIGAKGKLDGVEWECIGFMRRSVMVDGLNYPFTEYLLYDHYRGYAWLVESDGHWILARPMLMLPKNMGSGDPVSSPSQNTLLYKGQSYRHFQSAVATVNYVAGEFYWRVSVGDRAQMHDYVSPPNMLSCEESAGEQVWSESRYLEPLEVAQAFKLPQIRQPYKVGPCQPNPYLKLRNGAWLTFAAYLAASFILMVLSTMMSSDKLVFTKSGQATSDPTTLTLVTDKFEIPGRTSNVVVKTYAGVNNRWVYFHMALVNDATDEALDFGSEVSFYSGSDSDGAWSEGSTTNEVTLPRVPKGTYYMLVEMESGTYGAADMKPPEGDKPPPARATPGPSFGWSVSVVRDVPTWIFFWIGLFGMLPVPLWYWLRASSLETQRWTESDHPPTTSSE